MYEPRYIVACPKTFKRRYTGLGTQIKCHNLSNQMLMLLCLYVLKDFV